MVHGLGFSQVCGMHRDTTRKEFGAQCTQSEYGGVVVFHMSISSERLLAELADGRATPTIAVLFTLS